MAGRTAIILAGILAAAVAAQEKPAAVQTAKVDDFEGEHAGWAALKLDLTGSVGEDSDSKVAVTREAAHVKSGKGALSYSYEVAPGAVRLLALQKELDLSKMKSLRLWVKCNRANAIVIGLAEAGGVTYQATTACAADTWQEVAVNFDEFVPDNPDPNGTFDLGQIGGIHVWDIGGFLVNLLADLKGPRVIALDDVVFSSEALPRTTGPATVTRQVPVFLVDTFESPLIRWSPLSLDFSDTPKFNLFDAPVAIAAESPAGGGKQSLRFAYPRKGAKVHGILRSVEKNDLSKAAGLDLSLKTSTDGTFIVVLEEKDGSRYQKMVELKAADGWKGLSFPFTDLTLADDSQDDNGKLDASELKQITIADASALTGGAETDENRLWVDQVLFTLSP